MNSLSPDKLRLRRIHQREIVLINEGKDPDLAHEIAVSKETLRDLKEYDERLGGKPKTGR